MPTRSETARLNGAKSKGPKTDEGKARSSQNARKHGLFSEHVVLSFEEQSEYDQLLDEYMLEFNPVGPVERDLVYSIVTD